MPTKRLLDDYYPFGLAFNSYQSGLKNKYLYNGKELQEDLDLNWYDYGARNYDATLGRFFNQDRFAENYNDLSPYQYGRDNPMLFVDINGDSTAYYDNAGTLLYMSHDGLENAVTVVNDENKGEFFKTLIKDLMNEQSSDLRSFGTSYMLDGLESRFEETKNDTEHPKGGQWPNGLASEHGSFLYEKDGEVRVGEEDFAGGPGIVIFEGKNRKKDFVGKYHTHPNSGKENNGGTYQDPPSGDGTPGQMKDRNHQAKRGYRNAVVSTNNVYLYNEGQRDIVFDRKKRFKQ